MRFKSTEPGVLFEIFRNDSDDSYSDYTIRAQLETQFGNFSGENTAIHIVNFQAFKKKMNEFLEKRKGEVTLELTEDSEVRFFRRNNKGDIGVGFKLSRFAPSEEFLGPIVFSGFFPLDSEYLNNLYKELVQLFET